MTRSKDPWLVSLWPALALALLLLAVSQPALAHREHKKPAPTEQVVPAPRDRPTGLPAASTAPAQTGATMDAGDDRSRMGMAERLLDWLGRLHPLIVHFPIAFFPAALFTAVVGRRRPAFAAPVQFLVVAGGIVGPIAALLGWFDGGFSVATDDWLLAVHRWLGTVIGGGALALGAWAWWRPESNRSTAMIAWLGIITIALAIQGWFGGAMVHGIDHMNW